MQVTASVTSVSWIPSEAMDGMARLPMDVGLGHYDDPPPDAIAGADEIEQLRLADRFRFANHLAVEVEVADGAITEARNVGSAHLGATKVALGVGTITVPAVGYPAITTMELADDRSSVTFVQTAGGRTGAPLPRKLHRPPWIRLVAPTAWTTLALTVHADGTVSHELRGASPFPRHWIYDETGALTGKSGVISFDDWARSQAPDETPWHDHDREALVTEVETALERELSLAIMRGGETPHIEEHDTGATLLQQGGPGDQLLLLLDGVVQVDVDGEVLAEIGPGAVLGERAVLEGGLRTSTVTALTPVRVAVCEAAQLDRERLVDLSQGHRREEQQNP